MRLKSLHLVGFKTFAEKTEIELADGLTAVVGPNGCGKSNVGDALLWVMGEQNPRLLRGSDARDVIFSGTDRRKPLGMAEVCLTVDNSDGSLPVEFAEVSITRRVFRSGESQYLINNAPCRLKDIVELFLDTGIGKGAYSFISQGDIDAVLSARSEDRRELFEEAAGIKKYRLKKREAVRKLEQAETNLTRIRDIVSELEQQRSPLEKQAEEARKYLALSERLQTIEVDILVAEAQRVDYELYANRASLDMDRESIQQFDAEIAVLERAAESIGARLAESERELDSARMSQQAALSAVDRTESQLQLARERGRSAEQNSDSLDSELKQLALRIRALEVESGRLHDSVEEAGQLGEARRQELAALRARLQELDLALADAVRLGEDRQGLIRRMAEQRAQRESALSACRSRLEETLSQLDRLGVDKTTTQADAMRAGLKLDESRQALAASRASQREHQTDRDSQVEERRLALAAESEIRTKLDSILRLLSERKSRLATLVELQESGEGFYQGVRAVLSAVKQKRLSGNFIPVVDILTVPEELRVAIEVALGASAQDIVCDTEAEAKAAIAWLKSSRGGRATFLALPLLNPGSELDSANLRHFDGIEGVAADLVTADARYRKVLKLLLGRVAVASSLDAAVSASRTMRGWSRIVTVEGEVLSPGGALTGGSLQGRGAHLVGRKGEIDDLRQALPRLEADSVELSARLESSARTIGLLEQSIAESTLAMSGAQAAASASERDLESCERELERLRLTGAEIDAETARLRDASERLSAEAEQWQRQVDEGRRDDDLADDAVLRAQEESRRLAGLRDEARSNVSTAEVEAGRKAEQLSAMKREQTAVDAELARSANILSAKQEQRELAGTQFADSESLQRSLTEKLSEARDRQRECDQQFVLWRDRRQALLAESFDQQGAIKELFGRRAESTKSMHDSELQIARLEVRLAQASQRLQDEYGLTLDDVLRREGAVDVDKETATEVARLRREIRAMGTVNTGAVEEYARLTERHDFLSGQRADLESARTSLLATIGEIDESTRGTFMETFNAVSIEFARLFQQLFSGGSTQLILTNPDDLLETGIDIIAEPPGKKPQHLSLLSGGERALTATALLFAFLAVKPSPFVMLDEVDAPLDGANVERFVNLVTQFTEHTQFLVITHNPTTMEAAPRWYGVTMQEPGISRILSYRVPQDQTLESEPERALAAASA